MDFLVKLAKVILLTQKIREENYDIKFEDKNINTFEFNSKSCYKYSLDICAKKALEDLNLNKNLDQIIYLLCKYSWNDSQLWAESILEKDKINDS